MLDKTAPRKAGYFVKRKGVHECCEFFPLRCMPSTGPATAEIANLSTDNNIQRQSAPRYHVITTCRPVYTGLNNNGCHLTKEVYACRIAPCIAAQRNTGALLPQPLGLHHEGNVAYR